MFGGGGGNGGSHIRFSTNGGGSHGAGFDDIFSMFGGGAGGPGAGSAYERYGADDYEQPQPENGEDRNSKISLTLRQAVKGATVSLSVDGKKFKAVQIGGPSGGATTASDEHLDLPLDFDSLKSIGAMIGSGGLVVMDEDTCMVETARFFMRFTQNESLSLIHI